LAPHRLYLKANTTMLQQKQPTKEETQTDYNAETENNIKADYTKKS
jgi:hypothetical protein